MTAKLFAAALAVLAWHGGLLAAAPTKPIRTLLVLGDSLSEGFRLRPREAWPSLVGERLHALDPRWKIINASVSGSTTEGALRRLPSILHQRTDLFVVQLGINDAFRGVPVERIGANLQTIIDRVRQKNPHVALVVVGMQFPIVTSDEYVTAFARMYAEVAEKNSATLVPYLLAGVGGDPTLNLDDRIHPNAAGHRILAETMWKALEPLLQKLAASRDSPASP